VHGDEHLPARAKDVAVGLACAEEEEGKVAKPCLLGWVELVCIYQAILIVDVRMMVSSVVNHW
jgi:hypothetical protein